MGYNWVFHNFIFFFTKNSILLQHLEIRRGWFSSLFCYFVDKKSVKKSITSTLVVKVSQISNPPNSYTISCPCTLISNKVVLPSKFDQKPNRSSKMWDPQGMRRKSWIHSVVVYWLERGFEPGANFGQIFVTLRPASHFHCWPLSPCDWSWSKTEGGGLPCEVPKGTIQKISE